MINRIKKIEQKEIFELESIQCDICKTLFTKDQLLDIQEFHHIRFTGGYGSIFGDGTSVECDICQTCLYDIIKDYCKMED